MPDLESIQRKFERLKAFPPDPRIRQVRGQVALDLARARTTYSIYSLINHNPHTHIPFSRASWPFLFPTSTK